MCITGQLGRLEVQSKIQNLLSANSAEMHVFLVLDDDDGMARFGNPHVSRIASSNRACQVPSGANLTQLKETVRSQLQPWLRGELFMPSKTIGFNLSSWPDWHVLASIPNIDASQAKANEYSQDERQYILTTQLAQFSMLRSCAKLIAQHELASDFRYSSVMRLRDDHLVLSPLQVPAKLQAVLTKRCASWLGYHDKVFLAPRRDMDVVFRAFTEDFFLEPSISHRHVYNSETWFKRVFTHHGLLVEQVGPEVLPVVHTRCYHDTFCVPVLQCLSTTECNSDCISACNWQDRSQCSSHCNNTCTNGACLGLFDCAPPKERWTVIAPICDKHLVEVLRTIQHEKNAAKHETPVPASFSDWKTKVPNRARPFWL